MILLIKASLLVYWCILYRDAYCILTLKEFLNLYFVHCQYECGVAKLSGVSYGC